MTAKTLKAVKANHGACRFCFACNVNSPKEGAEEGKPKPRKSRTARDEMVPRYDEG